MLGFDPLFSCFRYLAGVSFLIYKLPFVECLMFGALISATDPVTVLSIFQVIWNFKLKIRIICFMLAFKRGIVEIFLCNKNSSVYKRPGDI